MILVTGSAAVKPEHIEQAVALSLEHVRRSRTEPGCISHAVHRDVEDANRLVFVEQWADGAALKTHFMVPESRAFVGALGALCSARPELAVYEAQLLKL
ncbi:antibiotic biosynthesis monooxygenase [Solimonas sp. K1W22B-7]|uniref:putative quinol monooxygenase n=1 Tax=Solimonas sp. K1W22B-7 TaxID=2303331 RepID=UPI000E33784F|nr:putative quinol monooxygenase [Solimonas sp. K1W22B-7]AXQ27808.1 antibiotic biosynthesis monooxygenase [Solimonas sp. K1W22B-7]